ncbi:MAG: phosphotransacetylase, partial [candidate division Zixibacteria bacterium]|nr:phosphotransacetylase [candidate division Zixibacteria bacterium]
METGVAQRPVDIEEYKNELAARIGQGRNLMRVVTGKAKRNPKRIVFPEGDSTRILRAAHIVAREGIGHPLILGKPDTIRALAREHEIDLDDIELLDHLASDKMEVYANKYYEKRSRKGVTLTRALRRMRERTYFGIMMLELGDCDAVLSGATMDYPSTILPALEIISLNEGITRVSGLFAMIQKDKVYLFADTMVNSDPTPEELAEIALGAANTAHAFNLTPKIAMLSFSNFGSARRPESAKVALATEIVKRKAPNLIVDGEMQADTALMPEFRQKYYPFSQLKDEANVLIFPDLNSGSIAYKLAQRLGGLQAVGPILVGFSKAIHVLHRTLDVNEIVDMAAIAVVDAQK